MESNLKSISSKLSKLSEEETYLFLKAFFTPAELRDLADRVLIVEGLVKGKSQRKISEEVGVSVSKVTAGSREFQFGSGKDIFEKFINLK